MNQGPTGAVEIGRGFDRGEVELTVASDLADELEAALDESGIEHERPIVHGDRSDVIVLGVKLVIESVPAFVELLNTFVHRHEGKEFRGQTKDGRPIDASGYSAKDILKFMREDTKGDV